MENDEIETIKENGTRFQNLRNDLIIPNHKRFVKTLVIKRLAIDLNISKWLEAIADCILYQDMILSISFRYRVRNIKY